MNGSQEWNLLFKLFEEPLLFSITIFDEKSPLQENLSVLLGF